MGGKKGTQTEDLRNYMEWIILHACSSLSSFLAPLLGLKGMHMLSEHTPNKTNSHVLKMTCASTKEEAGSTSCGERGREQASLVKRVSLANM